MTTADLHKILDDENRKISLDELKQIIYDEMIDCARRSTCVNHGDREINEVAGSGRFDAYWVGQQSAYKTVLDLLNKCGDYIKLPYLLCTSNKFACVIWRDSAGKVNKTYTMPIDEARAFLKEKENGLCNTND